MDLRFPYSPAEVAKVRMVQFGILSPDEIVNFNSSALFFSIFSFLLCSPFGCQEIIGKKNRKREEMKTVESLY